MACTPTCNPGRLTAAEERRELVVGVIRDAVPGRVGVRRHDRRGPGPDRAVHRQVPSDRREPQIHDPGDVHRRHDRHDVQGSRSRWPRRTSQIAEAEPVGHRHLVHGGTPSAAACAAARSWSSSIWCAGAAPAHRQSRSAASFVTTPGRGALRVPFEPLYVERVPAAYSAAAFASARCPSARWIIRGRAVGRRALDETGSVGRSSVTRRSRGARRAPLRRRLGQRARASSASADAAASTSRGERQPGAREVDVRVDEAGQDRRAREVDRRSASGESPTPTRWTWRPSIRTHSPVCGYKSVCTRAAR